MNLEMEHIVAAVIFAGVAVTTFIWALKKNLGVFDLAILFVAEVIFGTIFYAAYRYFFLGHL